MPCGHDHNGTLTTPAAPPQSDRLFTTLVAVVFSDVPELGAFVTTHTAYSWDSPPRALSTHRFSVSLRI